MKKKTTVKINLGCGPNGIAGWKNYDWGILPLLSRLPMLRKLLVGVGLLDSSYDIAWPKVILRDIRKHLDLEDSSVDYIYCSHVLEHFEKYETKKILRECKRVLKKYGVIRVVVPDLKKMMATYNGADDFCRKYYGYDKDVETGLMAMFIRGHQWMYDVESMKEMLTSTGFCNIIEVDFRKGNCPDVDLLDYEGHREISMYLEASST